MSGDGRTAAAERALAGHGISADVSVEGHEREIAAVRVRTEAEWARLAGDEGPALAEAVKAAGFRYVALDLAEDGGPEG